MNNKALGIGTRVRKQREKLGYTRDELAEMVGISTKFCADIELGHGMMSVETLCGLSKALMVSTDYILFGNSTNAIDDEAINLIKICKPENIEDLKGLMRIFIKVCNN